LILYFLLALAYSVVTPIYEGPDEPMHYAYVRHLIETGSLPPLTGYEEGHPAHQETSQPPLYYATAALLTFWTPDQGDYATLLERNPHFAYPASPTTPDNKNTWLHTPAEDFPYHRTVLAVRLTRLVSSLFGALGVVATWGLGRELWPSSDSLPLLAAGLTAFIPQFLFMSGLVTNDTAVMAFSACILWAVAHLARTLCPETGACGRLPHPTPYSLLPTPSPGACPEQSRGAGLRPRHALLLGLLLGLAALVKLSVLGLMLLACLFLVAIARTARLSWRATLGWLGLALTVTALVGGWWYARNWLLYGSPFNLLVHLSGPWIWDRPSSLWAALAQLGGVERSFWGTFGTGNVGLPDWVYATLRAACLLALAGWSLRLLRLTSPPKLRRAEGACPACPTCPEHGRGKRSRGKLVEGLVEGSPPTSPPKLGGTEGGPQRTTACLWALLWACCLLILALQVRWMQLMITPWGRQLFPALACFTCLLVEGWRGWLPAHSHPTPLLIPLVGLLLLSAAAPLAVIRPAYAPPAQLTPAQVATRAHPADFRLGHLARLVGYRLDQPSLPPDDWLTITLCWEVIGSTATDYTLFVQLIGADGLMVASRHTYPGQGRFPTSLWQPDDRFCDETRVHVGRSTPAPAVYHVEVGLLDAERDARLPIHTATGPLDHPLFLTRVRVAPETPPEVSIPVPMDYHLGETLALVGRGLLPETVHAGQPFSLTVYWRALVPPPADYRAFIHLLDPAGQITAQVDRSLRDGRYPTSFWVPGEVVSDTFTLLVPATQAPGRYRLASGMYTWPDLARLPVIAPDGQPQPESLVVLGSIVVK